MQSAIKPFLWILLFNAYTFFNSSIVSFLSVPISFKSNYFIVTITVPVDTHPVIFPLASAQLYKQWHTLHWKLTVPLACLALSLAFVWFLVELPREGCLWKLPNLDKEAIRHGKSNLETRLLDSRVLWESLWTLANAWADTRKKGLFQSDRQINPILGWKIHLLPLWEAREVKT